MSKLLGPVVATPAVAGRSYDSPNDWSISCTESASQRFHSHRYHHHRRHHHHHHQSCHLYHHTHPRMTGGVWCRSGRTQSCRSLRSLASCIRICASSVVGARLAEFLQSARSPTMRAHGRGATALPSWMYRAAYSACILDSAPRRRRTTSWLPRTTSQL
jgi:hypothetical protein